MKFLVTVDSDEYGMGVTVSIPANTPAGEIVGSLMLKRIISHGKVKEVWRANALPVTISIEQGKPSFSTLPDPEKVVVDPNGGIYPVNQLLVNLIDEAIRDDAEQIANNVGGKIISYFPSPNMYQMEVPSNIRGMFLGTVRYSTANFGSHLHYGKWNPPTDKSIQEPMAYEKACKHTILGD